MNLLQKLEQDYLDKHRPRLNIDSFGVGDTVRVNVRITEGTQERLQAYEGICIAKRGSGPNQAFTVRKISEGVGVERVFPTLSPMIESIKCIRRGDVRSAKLYYLRARQGKAMRIREAR